MSKRFFYFSVLILLLGILSVSCKKEKKKVEVPSEKIMVAKIGEFGVPESRVAKTFEFSKEFQKNKVITPELIKQYINRYYLGEIYLLAEAKAEGLDKDPEFLKIMKAHRIHEMTKQNGPLAKAILSKEYKVNNEELKELYKHLPYRLTLQQILVTSKPLADSLYRLLINGADFGQLASKYSNDLRSAVKDGVISNYLVAGMASPEYERVAFSLTKEHPISKPIKTEFGYHILKLMAREKQQVGGMVQERLKLVDIAKVRGQNEYIKHYIDSLFNRYHYKLNDKLIPVILHAFKRNDYFGTVDKSKIKPVLLKEKFLTYDKGFWTLEDFIDTYNNTGRYDRYRLEYPNDVRIMAKKLISKELMYWDGVARGLDKDKTYQKMMDYYYHHELEKIGEKRFIEENVKVTDEQAREFYKKHRDWWKNSTFEKVKPYVKNRLLNERRNQVRKKFLSDMRKKYKVEYNEQSLQRLTKMMNERKKLRAS